MTRMRYPDNPRGRKHALEAERPRRQPGRTEARGPRTRSASSTPPDRTREGAGKGIPAAIPVVLAALVAGSCGTARANPIDLFGVGARPAAMGNAFTAIADDPSAAYYNVAGLAQVRRTAAVLGIQLGHSALGDPNLCVEQDGVGCSEPFYYTEGGQLTTQQKRYGYDQPHGLTVGLALPLYQRLTFGLSAYLPVDVRFDAEGHVTGVGVRLARFQTTDPYLPDYVLYQNRAQRFAVYSGLAFQVIPGLAAGLGVTMLAGSELEVNMKGTVTLAPGPPDSGGDPTTEVILETVPQLSMALVTRASPVAGLLWDPGTVSPALENWRIGLSYRGESKMTAQAEINADLAVAAEIDTDDNPVTYGTTVTGIGTDVVGFFTPRQLTLGLTAHLAGRVRLAADLAWVDWSAFVPAMAELPESVQTMLGIDVLLASGRTVDTSTFRDTWVPRLGIEGRLGPFDTHTRMRTLDLYLRAGGAFEKNPFPRQTLETNLLNSDRVIGTTGIGATTHNPFVPDRALPLSLDLSLQYHYLWPTLHEKAFDPGGDYPDGYPVDGAYRSRGSVVQVAATLQVGF